MFLTNFRKYIQRVLGNLTIRLAHLDAQIIFQYYYREGFMIIVYPILYLITILNIERKR